MVKQISKIRVLERKIEDLGLETRCTKRSWVATTCASKRAFRIGVICANRILVVKVIAKILQRTRKSPQLGKIMISCQFCADLPTLGNSAPSMCNLTAQHRLTQIPLHQSPWVGKNSSSSSQQYHRNPQNKDSSVSH